MEVDSGRARSPELDEELGWLTRAVCHDLRGPMSAIGLAVSVLRRITEDPFTDRTRHDLEKVCQAIERSAGRSQVLIDDLLALTTAGCTREEVSAVSVNEVVASVLAERAVLIAEKRVHVEVQPDLGHAAAAETHVYQIFANLIGNALRYNDNPHPVVEVLRLDDGRSEFLTFKVKDNGSGIPEGDLDSVFLPFFKGEGGGVGIGLSIAEKFVRSYGGRICARNDGGVCFEFSLISARPATA